MTGEDIVRAARGWIGTRWKHQARNDTGIDCAGLVVNVAHELGLSDFDSTDYARYATDETMLALCREHLIEVRRDQLRTGDVMVLRFDQQRHLAIVADYPGQPGVLTIIHAYARDRKCVVEHIFDDAWLRAVGASVAGCFRFAGVDA